MLKIAVCDDDEKICNLLENYINDSCRILHIEVETESFISGKVLKRKLREGENYQIYFLDIELADDTGISVSDCIRNEIKDEAAQIVYRIAGKGTKEFSMLTSDHTITILGPLGNGFTKKDKKAILIGGGIGIPPMLQLAKELTCEKSIVLGFRDEEFLSEEFEPYGTVYKSSDNGTIGVKGTVMDAIREYGIEGTEIYACGPTPMLRAIQSYALEHGIEAQLSLEERMACGVGACLACVCKSKEIDDHSQVKNKRVCKDGPVFYAEEVEL